MAITSWLQLRGRLRPWMVLVALAAPTAVAGCKRAEAPAARAGESVGGAESTADGPAVPQADHGCPVAPAPGPPPQCSTDEECVEQHGAGWVCESGTRELDDGCGNKIEQPFGVCRPPAADAGSSAAADGESTDVAEAENPPTGEAVADDASGPAERIVAARRPAEMAQRVRDLVNIPVGRLEAGDRSAFVAIGAYGAPDGSASSPVRRGSVTVFGNVTVSGPGTIDQAVVASQIRRQAPLFRGCYDRALARNPELAGRLELDVKISEDGTVTPTVTQGDAALETGGVTTCVLYRLRTTSFSSAPPQGGEVHAHFGLDFRPSP